jgi:hypothetical protein
MMTFQPTGNPAPVMSLSELHMACLVGEEAVGHGLTMHRGGTGGDQELLDNNKCSHRDEICNKGLSIIWENPEFDPFGVDL